MMLDFAVEPAVRMLQALATVPPEQRLDTLALVIKVYIEQGSRWSSLADVWSRIEDAARLAQEE